MSHVAWRGTIATECQRLLATLLPSYSRANLRFPIDTPDLFHLPGDCSAVEIENSGDFRDVGALVMHKVFERDLRGLD
jgi:hypothetical protein